VYERVASLDEDNVSDAVKRLADGIAPYLPLTDAKKMATVTGLSALTPVFVRSPDQAFLGAAGSKW
jgi:hypothetical protein